MPIHGNLGGFIKPGFNPLAVGPERPPLVGGFYDAGNNNYGQLGLGNTTNRSSLVQVGALTTWLHIAAGYQHTIATNQTNELWAIGGRNIFGELGLGDTTSRSSPVQIGALTNWSNVSSGSYFNLAVKNDGTLYAWGLNHRGQLGLGNTTYAYSSPVQVGALTTWSKIASGFNHSLAIKTDGTLWAWGSNQTYGQLGDGTTANRSSPVQIGALTTWAQVAGGNNYSLAIKTDGTLWAWGAAGFGQLGLGGTTYYSSPVQVGALTTWSKLALGEDHSVAVKTDGTLWAWGGNSDGQLGDGTTTQRNSPVQVGALTNWNSLDIVPSIGGGAQSTFAIKADGTLWAWGKNNKGQLGQGNTTNYSSPVQVGALTTWLRLADTSFVTGLYAVNEE
jgi:alpha-tubulin suppressor-like RCC1 family protein